jgi:ABC-type Fe3+-hydroxamate transport system substrate-binding protein
VTDSLRIVSLVPSVTETLTAWARQPIACTRFCERPDLPHVGGTKDPDIARIAELAPDLVVVDTEENRREDYEALMANGLDVVALSVRSVEDVRAELAPLAARVEVDWEPTALPVPPPATMTAFVPIWRRPWMTIGRPTYGVSVLEHLGIVTVFEDDGPYPTVDLDEVRRRNPDVVLAPSEPYPFTTRQLPELSSVAPTTFVDGRDLFWWGDRTPNALDRLAASIFGG